MKDNNAQDPLAGYTYPGTKYVMQQLQQQQLTLPQPPAKSYPSKQQLQQFQQFKREVEQEQQQQHQQQQQQQQQHQQHQQQQLYLQYMQKGNPYTLPWVNYYPTNPPLYNLYEQPHIFQQIPLQPQPQMFHDVTLHYPPITTMAPMQHEVDWFFSKDGWKMFDSRRCNLIENMMHHNTQQEFELVYRDSKCIVNFRTMTFYDTTDQALYKLRRETAICSKMIRLGQGTWSFYNGLTWIQYDRFVTIQLEEKLRHGEIQFSVYMDGRDYTFDLDQNVQVCDSLPLGKGDRKIITRQWMTMQQLQDLGRMKKHQEQVYIEERRKLEERVKQHLIQKKAMQTSMKQMQRQHWNQIKKQQANPPGSTEFNLKDLDLGIRRPLEGNIFNDLPRMNLSDSPSIGVPESVSQPAHSESLNDIQLEESTND